MSEIRHLIAFWLIRLVITVIPKDESGRDFLRSAIGWMGRDVERGIKEHPEWGARLSKHADH